MCLPTMLGWRESFWSNINLQSVVTMFLTMMFSGIGLKTITELNGKHRISMLLRIPAVSCNLGSLHDFPPSPLQMYYHSTWLKGLDYLLKQFHSTDKTKADWRPVSGTTLPDWLIEITSLMWIEPFWVWLCKQQSTVLARDGPCHNESYQFGVFWAPTEKVTHLTQILQQHIQSAGGRMDDRATC